MGLEWKTDGIAKSAMGKRGIGGNGQFSDGKLAGSVEGFWREG
jgi:hypothetical protein